MWEKSRQRIDCLRWKESHH